MSFCFLSHNILKLLKNTSYRQNSAISFEVSTNQPVCQKLNSLIPQKNESQSQNWYATLSYKSPKLHVNKGQLKKDIKQTVEDLTSHVTHTLPLTSHTMWQPFCGNTCFQQLYKVPLSCKWQMFSCELLEQLPLISAMLLPWSSRANLAWLEGQTQIDRSLIKLGSKRFCGLAVRKLLHWTKISWFVTGLLNLLSSWAWHLTLLSLYPFSGLSMNQVNFSMTPKINNNP